MSFFRRPELILRMQVSSVRDILHKNLFSSRSDFISESLVVLLRVNICGSTSRILIHFHCSMSQSIFVFLVRLKPLVRALNENYEEVTIQVMETKSGQYECRFIPQTLGRYYFLLSVGGVAIPGSPFVVYLQLNFYFIFKKIHFTYVLAKQSLFIVLRLNKIHFELFNHLTYSR